VVDWAYNGGGLTTTIVANDIFPQVQSMMYMGDGTDIDALRVQSMVDSATITPATGGVVTISSQVSTTLLGFIELTPTMQGSISLNYVEPWQFRKQYDLLANTTPPPTIYTVEGDSLYVAPAAVTPILMRWYEKFTALSADGDTDWVLTNAPQIYLNGCLMLACAYTQDEREGMFRQKFAAAIKAANLNDTMTRQSGSRLIARPRSVA
ncbi:MAG: hypothetical protein ABL932_16540, partial [Terricaulis sp.]